MLELPMVTCFGMDCVTPLKTLAVMLQARRQVRFAELVLVTDTQAHSNLPQGVRYIHTKQGNKKVDCCGLKLPIDYELSLMRDTHLYIRTPFLLHMEWDSLVASPEAWNPHWLHYDYIGAPWPYPISEPGFPRVESHNNVGNGGFALKSRRFCQALSEIVDTSLSSHVSSDRFQCRVAAPLLRSKGLHFAPDHIAQRFSCENRIYSGQFGLHGKGTIKLNGINLEGLDY